MKALISLCIIWYKIQQVDINKDMKQKTVGIGDVILSIVLFAFLYLFYVIITAPFLWLFAVGDIPSMTSQSTIIEIIIEVIYVLTGVFLISLLITFIITRQNRIISFRWYYKRLVFTAIILFTIFAFFGTMSALFGPHGEITIQRKINAVHALTPAYFPPGVSHKRWIDSKLEQYYLCASNASSNAMTIYQTPLASHNSSLPQNINELWNQEQTNLNQNDALEKVSLKNGIGILKTYNDSPKGGDLKFFTNDSEVWLGLDERFCGGSTNLDVKNELIKTANSLY